MFDEAGTRKTDPWLSDNSTIRRWSINMSVGIRVLHRKEAKKSSTFLCEVIVKETVNLVVDFAEKIPVKRIKRPACKLG